MPTTSNFGWTTPADTDLVKDGAAAIRTLGNGIDTSLVDLKGGTTGQVLSKTSNTDLDYTWVTPNVGDITEVQAGTGISVASGTGPIPVITNTVATSFDAKGDLVVGTGADTFAKLGVGTNDYVLTADSGETTGMKWAAVSGGGYTLLETLTLSGSSTSSSTISTSYKHLFIEVKDIYFAGNDTFGFRLNSASSGYYGVQYGQNGSTVANDSWSNYNRWLMCDVGTSNGATDRLNGTIFIPRYNDTSSVVEVHTFARGELSGQRFRMTVGVYDNSAAITSITFYAGTTTTFSAGTAYIYGVS